MRFFGRTRYTVTSFHGLETLFVRETLWFRATRPEPIAQASNGAITDWLKKAGFELRERLLGPHLYETQIVAPGRTGEQMILDRWQTTPRSA